MEKKKHDVKCRCMKCGKIFNYNNTYSPCCNYTFINIDDEKYLDDLAVKFSYYADNINKLLKKIDE